MFKAGDASSKLVKLKSIPNGGGAPSRYTIFCNVLEKNDFNAIGSHFARVQSHLKELDF